MKRLSNSMTRRGRNRHGLLRLAMLAAFMLAGPLATGGAYGDTEDKSPRKVSRPKPRRSTPTHRPPRRTPGRGRADELVGPPSGVRSVPLSETVAIDPEDVDRPAEERMYSFSIKDGTYADLIDGFERATGRSVLGERPQGSGVNLTSTERMTYKEVLNRVRMLLFKHPTPYWLMETPDGFEVIRVTDYKRLIPKSDIYTSLSEFLAAKRDDNDLVMLLYTPPTGTVDDLKPFRDFVPDYAQIAQYEDTNSMLLFALVRDINKYLDLVNRFLSAETRDPRVLEVVEVQHITATKALDVLKQMIDGFGGDSAPPRRGRRGSQVVKAADAWGVDAYPDDMNDRILFLAVPEKLQEIREFLPLIDIAPAASDYPIVVVQVEHMPVGKLLQIINPILTGNRALAPGARSKKGKRSKGSDAPGLVKAGELQLIPIVETNQIVVLADEEDVARVQSLVQQFDKEQVTMEIVTLENVDNIEQAIANAQLLYKAAYGEAGGVQFHPAPNGTGVVVSGANALDLREAVKIVKDLDVEPVGGTPGLHKARLRHAKPSLVAATLTAMEKSGVPKVPPTKGRKRSRARRPAVPEGDKFRGDDANKILYVFCTDLEWEEEYWPLIQDFDADARPVLPQWQSIKILHADPQEVVRALQKFLGDAAEQNQIRITTEGDEILVFDASPELFAQLEELVRRYDVPDDSVQRTFTLEHISPGEARGIIQTLVLDRAGRAAPARRASKRKGRAKPAPAATAGDVRMAEFGDNLLVVAPPDIMEEIATLIEELDAPPDEREIRVYEFARGTDVVGLIEQLRPFFRGSSGGRAGRAKGGKREAAAAGDVMFVPQPSASKIVVSAPKSQLPAIEKMIAVLRPDPETAESVDVRFFELAHVEPEDVTGLMQNFLQLKYEEAIASGAIKGLDGGKGKGAKPTLLVEPDPRSGRLMVVGPAVLMAEVETLLGELDRADEQGDRVMRTVQLAKADATEMTNTIRAMLSGGVGTSSRSRDRGRRRGRSGEAQAQPVTSSSGGVTVVPAPGGNSLVLAGYVREVEEVEGWIKQLDAEAGAQKLTKVYTFSRANVEDFADAVMTLYDPGGGTGRPKQREDDFSVFESAGGPRSGKEIRLVTDTWGGTMVVTASPVIMGLIDDLYGRFEGTEDQGPDFLYGSERGGNLKMVELEYADPYDASFTLESMAIELYGEERAPKISYLPFTNILTIRGDPNLFDEIDDLIAKYIDKKAPGYDEEHIEIVTLPGGLSPEDYIHLIKSRLRSVDIEVGPVTPDAVDIETMIERVRPGSVKPREEAKETDWTNAPNERANQPVGGEYAPCVLPACLGAAIDAAVTAAVAQADPDQPDPDQEEPNQEEPNQDAPAPPAPHEEEDDVPDAGDEGPIGPSKEAILRSLMTVGEITDNVDDESAAQERGKVELRYDNKTGVLYMKGKSRDLTRVRDMIDELKTEIAELKKPVDVRVYKVKYIDVRIAAQILEAMFNAQRTPSTRGRTQQQRKAQGKQQQQQGKQGEEGKDGRSRPEDQLQKLLQSMQQSQGQGGLAGGSIRVYPDTRMKTLIIRAATEDYPVILELLATIDQPSGGVGKDFKIIELKKLNAAEVEEMLKTLLGVDERAARAAARRTPRGANPQQAAQAAQAMQQQILQMAGAGDEGINIAEEVKIASSPAMNTLMVMGPEQAIQIVEEFVEKLEAQDVPTWEFRRYVLQFVDAKVMAPQLQKLLQGPDRRRRGGGAEGFDPNGINQPTIIVEEDTNALLVRALSIDFPKIDPLINELDKKPEKEQAVMEFPLPRVMDAGKVAKALDTIYTSGKGSSRARQIEIVGETDTNTLLVKVPPELEKEVTERINNMTRKAVDEKIPVPIKLKEAIPTQIAQQILAAFGADPRKSSITITGDDATKQLFVIAPPELMPQIEKLVELLDVPGDLASLKVYKCTNARATDVLEKLKPLVQQMLTALGGGTRGSREVFSATADIRSNSIIVAGSTNTHRFVADLLETLDVPENRPYVREIAVYALQRAKAADIANNINRLYKDTKDGSEPPEAQANVATNTLIVRATQAQHEEIKRDIIDKLDEFAKNPPITLQQRTFSLQFAKADDVTATLTQLFTNRRQAYQGAKVENLDPAELTVSITPLVQPNQIVVMASENNMKIVEQQLQSLDVEGADEVLARDTRIYEMQFLDPNNAAQVINNAFRTQGGRVPLQDQVTVSVIWSTQSVAVTANPDNQKTVAALLQDMDVDTGQNQVRRTYAMKNAQASDVANIVNQAMRSIRRPQQGRLPVSVTPNDTLNMLIMSGTVAELEEVEALVAELDQEPSELAGRVVQVYKLKYADPGSTIGTISNAFPRTRGMRPEDQVTCGYAWGTSALVVNASPKNQEKVAELLELIDTAGTERKTYLIPLKEANSDDAARGLAQLFRQTVRQKQGDTQMQMWSDPRTNTLVVYATEEEYQKVLSLIESLDVPPSVAMNEMKVYPIRYADPNGIVNVINAQFRQARGHTNPRDQVTAVTEWATQSIIVSASPKNHEAIADLIAQIDVEGSGSRQTHVLKLKNANADELARTLSGSIQRDRTRRGDEMRIAADAATNSLIVYASQKEMTDLQPLLESLDVEPDLEKERQFKTFKLTYGDAYSLSEMINQTFRMSRNPRDQVTAVPDWASNTVLVTASPDNMKRVEKLAEEMDTKRDAAQQIRVVQVKHGDPAVIAEMLSEVFSATAAGGRRFWMPQQGGISISHTPGTDTLLIKAKEAEFDEILAVLDQLDTADAGPGEIRTFALQYTDATEMQQILETYLRKPSSTGGRGRGRRRAGPSGDLVGNVRISVSTQSNSLIVSGDTEELDRLAAVIEKVDVQVEGGDAPRLVTLKHAIPSVVEPTLTELFSQQGGRGGRGRGGSGASIVPVIVADDASHSLIVRAAPKDFHMIEELVATLDTEDAGPSEIEIFTLQYTDATEMQGILETYLQRPGAESRSSRRGRRGSGVTGAQLAGDVRISVSEVNNSLIVSGDRQQLDHIAKVIAQIDVETEGGTTPQIIVLQYAVPSVVEPILTQLFIEGGPRGGRGGRGSSPSQMVPVIVADDATDSLIVRANTVDLAHIKSLVATLDTEEASDEGGIKIVRLQAGVDVVELADMLQQLLDQDTKIKEEARSGKGRARVERVALSADRRTNSILLAGSRSRFEEVEQLIRSLEAQGPVGGKTAVIIRPKNMDPDEIKRVLEGVIEDNQGSGSRRGAGRSSGSRSRGSRGRR